VIVVGRLVGPLARWLVIFLVVLEENFGGRYKRAEWPVLVAILEPIGVIGLFALVGELMHLGPPFGQSSVLFHTTGVIPFYLFMQLTFRVRLWDTIHRLPRTSGLDWLLATVVSDYLAKIIILAILYVGMMMVGINDVLPSDPLQCLLALGAMALLGLGIGLVNAVLSGILTSWTYIYVVAIRFWMAFSGVLFVMDYMPPDMREIGEANPVATAITWFRLGQYGNYPSMTMNRGLLFVWIAATILIGGTALAYTKRWRRLQ
jgi:capsular polysaccharide transport system permease protein